MIKKTTNHGKTVYKVDLRIPDREKGLKRIRRFCKTLEQAKALEKDLKADRSTEGFWSSLRPIQKLQAIKLWEEHLNANNTTQHSSISLKEAVAIYLQRKMSMGLRPTSLRFIRYIVKRMERELPVQHVYQVTTHHFESWFMCAGYTRSTIKGIINKIGPFFNWAIREGYCENNPTKSVELPREDDKPPGIFTNAQVEIILDTAVDMYPDMIPYFAVGFFAGLRPEEIKRLAWVDVKEGFIEVQAAKSKTRQRRLVTIEGNLEKWLDRGGNLPPTRPLLKRRLIIKQCGVQWHHDGMRHTYASNHLAHYENPNKTAHELGHRDTNMLYRHYRELVSNAVASDYWSISPKDCR